MTRPLKLEDFPPSVQRRLRLEQGKRPVRATPKIRLPKSGYDSKLEEEWAQNLAAKKAAGEIENWRHHPLTLILPSGTRYSPDFIVTRLELDSLPHGDAIFYEVKGRRRRGEREVLLSAAQMVREWFGARLFLVWKDKSGWQEQEITA